MSLPQEVDIKIGLDGSSFKAFAHCIAIGEAELIIDGIEKAEELVAFAKHEDRTFGLEANQATVGKPG